MPELDAAAIALIQKFEGCDLHPSWPGGKSGVTLGHGCDIGADPNSLEAWRPHIPPEHFDRLVVAKGVTGIAAEALARQLHDITLTQEACDDVFLARDIPTAMNNTLATYPMAADLPPKSLGALVSLVFNRGGSLGGPTRVEMAHIHDHLVAKEYESVPGDFAGMTRLWPDDDGPTASNLMGRRFAEAALFAAGLREAGTAFMGAILLGDGGPAVARLQTALGINADGSFGPATLRAVLSFQEAHSITPDGIVGALTASKMGIV